MTRDNTHFCRQVGVIGKCLLGSMNPASPSAGSQSIPECLCTCQATDTFRKCYLNEATSYDSSAHRTSTIFMPLRNHEATRTAPNKLGKQPDSGQECEENGPVVTRPFSQTNSTDSVSHAPKAEDDQGPEPIMYKMHQFSLYETASRYYIVGADVTESRYRILKIDRMTESADLTMTDDKILYSQQEINQILDTIGDGNKGTGGIKLRCTTWGLLGFIKFTGPYYMLLITKKSTVAMVGGHYVYQIDGTELVPLTATRFKPDIRNTEETRFLSILNNLDLTRSFYYSYSYDITRTLQHNIARERQALASGVPCTSHNDFNAMFVWNSHLLQPAIKALREPFDWCRPIIHGYIDQAGVFRLA